MIRNPTKNKVIVKKKRVVKCSFGKALGLMFSRKTRAGLIFEFNKEQLVPLHTLFVFYPIDVLFLDKSKRVVEIKENFKPFTLFFPKKKAKYVVELPCSSVKESNTEIGDVIEFE